MGRRSAIIGAVILLVAAGVIAYFGLRGDGEDPTTPTTLAADTTVTTPPSTAQTDSVPTSTQPPPSSTVTTDSSVPTSTPESSVPDTAPESTTTTTLPPVEDPDAGEDALAPVPLGQALVHGTWEIGISKVDLDAGETVAAMYEANVVPDPGFRYVLVELSGTNIGDTHAEPVFDVGAVNGDFRHEFTFDECGQISYALIDVMPQPPGSHMTANVCFNLPEEQVTEDLVLTLGFFSEAGQERFFALHD